MSSDEEEPSPSKRSVGRPRKIPSPDKSKRVEDDMDGKHYACQVCDQVFLHKANFLRHTTRHEKPGGFVCVICHEPFTTDWDRNRHKRDAHSVYRCRICNDEFPIEQDYNDHIIVEHEGRDRDYEVCPTCGQNFRTASQLKVHIESNCGTQKRFKCETCNQRYLSQASLNAHSIKHVADNRHLCNYCGASFTNKGQLKVHERMHTGEKPYKCTQCDKAFAHRESLITHSTTHSGIKPYHCSYCDSRFSCIGNLLKHRRSRPDTCGLPQYCQTNKIVARPTSKTLPFLTDRQSTVPKVVQRSGSSKSRPSKPKGSPESKPSIKRLIQFKQNDSDDDGDHYQGADDSDEEDERKPPSKFARIGSPKKHQLVDLKVESYDSEEASSSDVPMTLGKKPLHTIETMEVEVSDIKIESEFTYEEVTGEEILEETIYYEDSYSQSADDMIVESKPYTTSPEGKIREKKTPVRKEKHPRDFDDDDDDDDIAYKDDEDDEDYVEPKVRKVFTEKPPVITNPRRRGRHRVVRPPKEVNENVVPIDVAERERVLEEQRSMLETSMTKLSEDTYRCLSCPLQYSSAYFAGRHLQKDHGVYLKELLKTLRFGARVKFYQCRLCGRQYNKESILEKHIKLHGPDGSLLHKCTCCTTWYATEDEAREHALKMHLDRLKCKTCGLLFRNNVEQKIHAQREHGGPSKSKCGTHCCKTCGKLFASKLAVSDHERSNCGENPIYSCDICSKPFRTAASLKNHSTVHTNELPHSCQYCGKSFRCRGQVTVHERIHTGVTPYACEFCPKKFAHRESYMTHLSTHTGIKRYMCSGCGTRFSCISGVQCHRKSHASSCGLIPTFSKPTGPNGYHVLPDDYVYPYPENARN